MTEKILAAHEAQKRILESRLISGSYYHLSRDLEAEKCVYGTHCFYSEHGTSAIELEGMVDQLRISITRGEEALSIGELPHSAVKMALRAMCKAIDAGYMEVSLSSLIAAGGDNRGAQDLLEALVREGLILPAEGVSLDVRITQLGAISAEDALRAAKQGEYARSKFDEIEDAAKGASAKEDTLIRDTIPKFKALDFFTRRVLLHLAASCDTMERVTHGEVSDLLDDLGVPEPSKVTESLVRDGWLSRLYATAYTDMSVPRYSVRQPTVARVLAAIGDAKDRDL